MMMASNICQQLMKKIWRSYANDLDNASEDEGIYTIGLRFRNGRVQYIYVGHADDMHERLGKHKSGNKQAIDKFVKKEFRRNGGQDLRIKWKTEPDHMCVEGEYLDCMARKLGYWPKYNMQDGNRCNRR
ncbi:hypothetical protein OS493_027793 [Desmophyllum pertusum]|uniref:GIY-YIG domain-containing protein n=1 Tax=Desmophyllum pertusum TaxID=174260 RepID=A0A9W9YX92_9CNID|nr:hypothetical protein OS493_027793 [Desmophyllum pertusum]